MRMQNAQIDKMADADRGHRKEKNRIHRRIAEAQTAEARLNEEATTIVSSSLTNALKSVTEKLVDIRNQDQIEISSNNKSTYSDGRPDAKKLA